MAREATRLSAVIPDGTTAFFAGEAFQFDASGKATTVGGAGEAIDGVINEGCSATATNALQADVLGLTTMIAGGALTAGTHRALMVNASGQAVAYVAAASNVHVANWIPGPNQTSAASSEAISVVLVGSPLDR